MTDEPLDPFAALEPFLEALQAATPTPGGGAAAAVVGALGAALGGMVASVTVGREMYAEVEGPMRSVLARASAVRERMLSLARQDAEAYERFLAARRLPRESEEDRTVRAAAVAEAALAVTEIPLETMETALLVLETAGYVAARGNRNAATDGAVGAVLAHAALRAAHLNVRTNLPSLADEDARQRIESRAAELAARAAALESAALDAARPS